MEYIEFMKKVLVIAYYFPPSGGPGVQRVLKHVQYLQEFGWKPIVLTVANGDFPARDESLLQKIPQDIRVERTHIYEPYDLYRKFTGKDKSVALDVNNIKKEGQSRSLTESIAEFIRSTIFIPDARIGWMFTAVKAAHHIIKEEGIDMLYSSSPPYTCSLIARAVKRSTGLPWVAGFRDPWTDFLTTPKRWFLPKMIDKALEKSVFTEADAIESAWQGITDDALRKYPSLKPAKFYHVPNGFDSADFPTPVAHENEVCTITYTGSMYGRRNPATLFQAIEQLIRDGQIQAERFRLRFIGRMGAEVMEMIEKTSFRHSIDIVPYVPHRESIRALQQADVTLLIVDEAKESAEIVPGKVFEYIGVNKPILALAPREGAAAQHILDSKSGWVVNQQDIQHIAKILLHIVTSFEQKTLQHSPDTDIIRTFERKEAAHSLAKIFTSLS